MRFGDNGRGTSRDGGDINFVELPELARRAVTGSSNFNDRDDFFDALIQAAKEGTYPQLLLQNQEKISESIRIDASLGHPKALLLSILMLETTDKDWGVSSEDLVTAVREGLTDSTARLLEEAEGILNGRIAHFPDRLTASSDALVARSPSDLVITDEQISKFIRRSDPKRLSREFSENKQLSIIVNNFMKATELLGQPTDETGNLRYLPNAYEKITLNFLKDWIDSSPNDYDCTKLLHLPRQREVTDRIIWLCGSETPEGKEAAMLIADLLPRCGLIGDNGEVSKNAKWLLTALREHVSLLIQEEAMESRSLNTSDYHPSS